jgi:Ca2+-binding RTX toxin-like protein
MTRKNQSTLNLEQLDERIVPATVKGSTASGLTWTYNDVTNRMVINGTAGNDQIMLLGGGQDLFLVDKMSPYYVDTGVKLSSTLKIQVNGGGGDDFIYNGLFSFQYDRATLSGGSGNDLIRAGGGKDTLLGDDGDDCLVGSFGYMGGSATMIGGTGADTYITHHDRAGGNDTVFDFDEFEDVQYDSPLGQAASLQMSGGDPMIVWYNGAQVWQSR